MMFVLKGIAWAVVVALSLFLMVVGVGIAAEVWGEKALLIPIVGACLVAGFVVAGGLE